MKIHKLKAPNFKVALLYFPISVLSVPSGLFDQNNDLGPLAFLALSISMFSAICISLLGWVLRVKRTGLHNFVLISLLVTLGAVRGYLLHEASSWLDVSVSLDQLSWMRNSIISTTGWVLILSQLIGQLEHARREFERKFASRSLQLASDSNFEPHGTYLESLSNVSALQANLNRIASEIRASGLKQEDLIQAAARVRDQLENSLRPLSHRIWFNELRNRPQFRVIAIWQEGVRSLRLIPWLSALIAGLGFFVGASSQLPLIELTVRTIFLTGLTLASFVILKKTKLGRGNWVRSFLLLALAAIVPYLLTEVISSVTIGSSFMEPIAPTLIPASANIFLAIVISTLQQMREDWDYVMETLDKSLESDINANLRLATYLHNSLQSELSQIAAKLELLDEGSSTEKELLLAQLEEISQREIARDAENSEIQPPERIAKVISGWKGIIDVEFDSDQLDLLTAEQQAVACLAIEEGIANAVRHGSAKTMAVKIIADSGVKILEMSNPFRDKRENASGLGSQWLERVSQIKPRIEFVNQLRVIRIQL